jgi:acetylglutamate kinase
MDKLYVIKIGGEVVDDPAKLETFLHQFSSIAEKKILVHGGGKLATELATKLSLPQQMIEGRRVTDADTLKVAAMVYGGLINKQIVAALQARNINAIGFTGADGNLILAHKRVATVDFGFVGDIDKVNVSLLTNFLDQGIVPVLAPLTHDGKGQLLNTNADTIAKTVAESLSEFFEIHLVYSFTRSGVLRNPEDESSVIGSLNRNQYQDLKTEGSVFAGMIPKLDNAFDAINGGVQKLTIGSATELMDIINGKAGTHIIHG